VDVSSEIKAAIVTFILLVFTGAVVPGGRVLVLPLMFTLIMILLYWAARPKDKKE
jgi:hypothetical protein